MTDIIETMRGLRNQTITFEATMSALTVRLWKATARLGNAVAVKSDD